VRVTSIPPCYGAIASPEDVGGRYLSGPSFETAASRFDDALVRDRLVDEFRFWIRPVVAGAGQRLFEDVETSGLNLRLTDEERLEDGSVTLTYVPR
jgi:hypothetical protein